MSVRSTGASPPALSASPSLNARRAPPSLSSVYNYQMDDIKRQASSKLRFFIEFSKAVAILLIGAWHYFGFIFPGKHFYVMSRGAMSEIVHGIDGIESLLYSAWFALTSFGYKAATFFVIASGFGLYFSHLRNPIPWRTFYIKRFVRVVPLYWAAILLYFFAVLREDGTVKGLMANLFLVQTYTPYEVEYGALWFVGYIVQLYVLFPVFVLLFRNSSVR
jgi:peptidoglycan/LPS O-acetylase OafA/YrhL